LDTQVRRDVETHAAQLSEAGLGIRIHNYKEASWPNDMHVASHRVSARIAASP